MKKTLKHSLLLIFVLVLVFSAKVYPKANATFTKADNVLSLKITPDVTITPKARLVAFVYSFRYMRANGAHFTNIVTTYDGTLDTASIVDPIDPSYRIITFNFVDGVTSQIWTSGQEYTLFTVEAMGLGTNSISLVADLPSYVYGPYLEIGTSDVTLYAPPFYAGSDNLVLTTSLNGLWKYATQNVILGKYWLGTGTSNWTTDANWSDGSKPTAVQDVAIIAGGVQPIADVGSVCQKLLVEAGASVNIATTGTLTVNGDLSVTDDNSFVVQSGGSLITLGAVPSGNKVKVQRYIAGADWASGRDGWHFLSSPVAAQAITGAFLPSGSGNDYDMYVHNEPTHYWLNQKNAANAALFVNFTPGKGYLVAYEQAGTKEFVGTLNTGDVTRPMSNSGNDDIYGFNFVGNPFSSALNWINDNSYGDKTHLCNYAYIWNSAAKAYDVLDGVSTGAGSPIPAMNGFMVYTDLPTGTVTIPASKRIHSSTTFYKSSEPKIKLIARDIDGESYNTSYVKFDPQATAGFELSADAPAITGGYAPMFYSVASNRALTVNTLPEAYGGLVIPFGFVKNEFSNYTIELTESIGGHTLNLHDLKTNTVVNLTQNPVYSFTAAAGDDPNRFVLVLDSKLGVDKVEALAAANVYSIDNRIGINNVNGDTQMDIINVQGQLLKSYKFFSNGNHEISVNLSTGVYMVRLSNGGELRTMKVFVK